MMKGDFNFPYAHYQSYDEMSEMDKTAIKLAKETCKRSYSPFSNFRVAVVAVLENGELFSAANQESEVFPSGMCAERILLYNVASNHTQSNISSLYIYGDTSTSICSPCGACRQVIFDVQKRQKSAIRVVMCGNSEALVVEQSQWLLPFAFEM